MSTLKQDCAPASLYKIIKKHSLTTTVDTASKASPCTSSAISTLSPGYIASTNAESDTANPSADATAPFGKTKNQSPLFEPANPQLAPATIQDLFPARHSRTNRDFYHANRRYQTYHFDKDLEAGLSSPAQHRKLPFLRRNLRPYLAERLNPPTTIQNHWGDADDQLGHCCQNTVWPHHTNTDLEAGILLPSSAPKLRPVLRKTLFLRQCLRPRYSAKIRNQTTREAMFAVMLMVGLLVFSFLKYPAVIRLTHTDNWVKDDYVSRKAMSLWAW